MGGGGAGPLGTVGGALPDRRRRDRPRQGCASTASPAWTSAPASGSRSCPCWCAPPNERQDSRPHAACTPPRGTPPGALIPDTGGTLRRAVRPPTTINGRSIWAQDTVHRQAPQPGLRGRRGVLGLRHDRDPAPDRHPRRGTARADPPQHHRIPAALHRRARPAAADRPLQDRHRTAAARQPRTRRRAQRDRQPAPRTNGAIPLVAAYDVRERVWNPPMPLLFQRSVGSEHRAITPTALRKLLLNALAATGLTDAAGAPLVFSPHDFRRIFVTDAIMSGLPPHIAQIICGHATFRTTLGYKADLPGRGDRSPPGVHRPPPRDPPQRGVPDPHRRGMGRVPRPLREAEGLHRHLRPRLRNTLHP